ncbi:MAG: DNA repair protein RecO [Deltaproteobacteria bacterium]|nr:DNA repair protein RecO [Deltaproteobacteria bacterium]
MRRGPNNAEAIVLGAIDYGESDRILTFYTEEFGKLKAIAKGARRSRKRFVGALDAPARVRGVFYSNGPDALLRVDSAMLLEGFCRTKTGVLRYAEACCLVELVSETTREGQATPGIYGLLLDFLRLMEAGGLEVSPRFFEMKLLGLAGYLPHLEGCVVCRRRFDGTEGARVYFLSDKGGAVCGRCNGADAGPSVSASTCRMLDAATRLDTGKLARLRPAASFEREAGEILDGFIRHQLGKELKTKRFLAAMRDADTGRDAV